MLATTAAAAPAFAQTAFSTLAIQGVARPATSAGVDTVATTATAEVASDSVGSDVDAVVVTGVRGGERRTVADSPVPIDVIGGAQIQATGKVGLKEILNTLVPSFNLPGINGGGTSWAVRAITLRGLNGDQALFLVNGKRRHTTALINNLARVGSGGVPVDLDLIPASAIDHVEVLRDGAAAQYGSDAIAGVINFILKEGATGGSASVTWGANYWGDGATIQGAADYGLKLGDQGGFAHLSIDVKHNQPASRSVASTTVHLYNLLPGGVADPRDLTADRYFYGHSYGPGEETLVDTAYDAELPVTSNIKAYSTTTLSYRDSRKNTGSFLPNNINSLPEIYPNGFNALRRIYEWDVQSTWGVRGKAGEWAWDLSTSIAYDHARLDAENTLNATLGPTSQTRFHLSNQIYTQWTNTLDISRALSVGVLPAPVTVAFGAEHRYERYQVEAGEPNSYIVGTYVIPAGQPHAGLHPNPGLASYTGAAPGDAGSASRNNFAGYVDLSTKLASNWYVGLAGRYEHYTDSAGDTASGKFTTRWEFLPGYAFRATVSNGFRAPSLAQEVFASSTISGKTVTDSSGAPVFITSPTKFFPASTPEAKALGATPLRPETSVNYSVGFTAEPVSRLRFTADAYQIDIDDRIVATGQLSLTAANLTSTAALNGLLARFPNGLIAQYYTNAVNTRTRGIDIVGEYALDLGPYGSLNLNAAYSYNKTTIRAIKPTPAIMTAVNPAFVLFDRQKQADITVATPRDKIILGAVWRWRRLGVNLHETRYGRYIEVNSVGSPSLDRTYTPKWVTDLDVSLEVRDGTTIAAGANNLFNQHPDRIGVVNPDTGSGQYGSFSPFGITGGFYYVRLTQRL
ncbi:MAG TPA: TonB-dependent receptor [Caulobacteraceae bacterium]